MRVLLLFPKLNNLVFFGVYEPLVMEIFSAIAKEEGCEVELIDLRVDPRGCERLARRGYIPDMIGLTTHGFPEIPIVNSCVRTCKKLWPNSVVVIGGGQATVTPELFDQQNIDLIVRGPGERVWRDLCRTGISPRKCRTIEDPQPPHVYSYPLPDREITAKYRKHYKTNIPHHTGRPWGRRGRTGFTLLTQGCPFRCSFCVIWPANLGLYRKRPIPEIVAELKTMEESYIYLGDDNTFADARYAGQLADAIREAGIHKEISSYCRADHICKHPDLLKKWYDIGLRYLVIGIEAVNNEKLQQFNKKTDRDQNILSLKILREIGIFAIPHILISPEMAAQDFEDVYRFIDENEFEYPVTIPLTPLPGTADYAMYKAQGRILTDKLEFYSFMYTVIEPTQMSLRAFNDQYDRLIFRTWSWSRFLRGKCGMLSLLGFIKWWAFVRLLVLQLRWKRRALYRDADRRAKALEPQMGRSNLQANWSALVHGTREMVETSCWNDAIADWRTALGCGYVTTDADTLESAQTTTYATAQKIPAILRPSCREQVQECLRIANKFGVAVYPISSGKNWGYGSSVPVAAVSALLDLSRMNRILEFSEELAYVTVEPGVTQSQLFDFLRQKRSGLWMDASGGSPESSLIGNTVERGFGHTPYGDHFAHSCGLEVILPTGERIETGFARFPDTKTGPLYRWGLGPVLDGLFSQSNLGVVTRMSIWLMPAPEYFQAFFFSCKFDSMLGPVVDALRPLRINGTIRSGMHIGNDYKVLSGLQQYPWSETGGNIPLSPELMEKFRSDLRVGAWNGSGALYGTRTQVAEARRLIKRALAGKVNKLQFLDDRKLRLAKRFAKPYQLLTGWNLAKTLPMLQSVYDLMKGIPTNKPLESTYWRKRTPVPADMNPDRDGCGLLWYAPIVPAYGKDVEALGRVVVKTMLEDGFEPMISLTLLNERAIACVISISFDRGVPGEDDRAMSCYHRLFRNVTSLGCRPYRLGIHSMAEMNMHDVYNGFLESIKSTVDPAGILSPGRYL